MYHNIFIDRLNEKDEQHFTSSIGLFLRRKLDIPFKKLCNIFTRATIIRTNNQSYKSDEEYYNGLSLDMVALSQYPLSRKKNANNIVVERYPQLEPGESYIFVGNHTCPEDIETILNIIDRNAYLVLGSVESLKYNPEIYLSWLNGMIVFDILDPKQRKELFPKMERVLRTQSILIFPESSHNYSFNNLINPLYDGPVNLALKTGKKIVPVVMVKDKENRVSYIDVCNPIDVKTLHLDIQQYYPGKKEDAKHHIKCISSYLRDQMATAVYYLITRHIEPIKREKYGDIEQFYIKEYVADVFEKLKWQHDVFEAEYLTKKTEDDLQQEEVVKALGRVCMNETVNDSCIDRRVCRQRLVDMNRKDVVANLRDYFYNGTL